MSEKIKFSIPLEHGEIQKAHDLIKIMSANRDIKQLKSFSDYLYKKSKEASDKDHRRDAFMLEDLGKLAIEVISDAQEQIEADK